MKRGAFIATEEFEAQRGDRLSKGLALRSPFAVPPASDGKGEIGTAPVNTSRSSVEVGRAFFSVGAGAAAKLALQRQSAERTLLIIRNASTSAGNLLVGFDFAPSSPLNCDLEIAPGGLALLDVAVPQNEIWVASVGGSAGSIGFSTAKRKKP
jgi:hypothetical protein